MAKIKKLAVLLLSVLMVCVIGVMASGCSDSDKIKELSQRIAALEEENKSLSEELQSIDYKNLQQSITALKEELKNLTERLQEIESEELLQRIENLKKQIEQLENRLQDIENETNTPKEPIEVRGSFCTLEVAYNNGWLSEDNLKSISCGYNDFYNYEDNPYSGMYDPNEELSVEMENELKQAYLNQYAKYPDGLLEYVILTYYGTYNGNIAVVMFSDYICIDPPDDVPDRSYIGTVIFTRYAFMDIIVYHID